MIVPYIKGAINVNVEENKAIASMKEEISELKEEMLKLNNLVFDMIKELKINASMKMDSENSKEIDDILKKCMDNF
ncbi:MAG: hypothetical protein A370_04381 [Clostridium sp. Maddingley MBC34-26]|nr:MAG: hypothetical protein A370_04381 [Clostridium sp. Maddingley MBC34-26]